jgi:hypothetical protein
MNGSFFRRGPTKSCTKASCWLLQIFRSSASRRCFSASDMSTNRERTWRTFASSCSVAVLQSGARCIGVGLGAGVGGEAGAEGSRLWGMVEAMGLVGVCIGRGGCRVDDMGAFRLVSDDRGGKAGGGGGKWCLWLSGSFIVICTHNTTHKFLVLGVCCVGTDERHNSGNGLSIHRTLTRWIGVGRR